MTHKAIQRRSVIASIVALLRGSHTVRDLRQSSDFRKALLCVALLIAAFSATTAYAASLSGTVVAGPAAVNLTTTGTADWVDWGSINALSVDRKAGVATQISGLTPVGSITGRFGNDPLWSTLNWTDGTPTATKTNWSGGIYFLGIGNGYQFTVPADTTQRTLKLYVGGWMSTSEVRATLSDGSAGPSIVTFSGAGVHSAIVTLIFSAASSGQTLTVRHIMQSGGGNIGLQAAALVQAVGNAAPTLNPIGDKVGLVGSPLLFSVSASDPDGPPPLAMTIVSSVPALPATASYGDNGNGTGSFVWTPDAASAGSYQVTFAATDGAGLVAQRTIVITVNTAATGGSLVASSTSTPAAVNLTTTGTADWIRWGLTTAASVDRKSGVAAQISGLTPLGAVAGRFGADAHWSTHSWTDGAPTASNSGFSGGIFSLGIGNGYQLTVSADTTPRTLKLYVGGYVSTSEIRATLSDGSAGPSITTFSGTGVHSAIITLTYNAASSGQTLTVRHTMTAGTGNIGVQAAALTQANGGGGNVAPTLDAISDKTVVKGTPLTFTVTAHDPDGPLPLAMARSNSVPALPVAASYVDNGNGTGTFSWTPGSANVGSYLVTFTATDGAGLAAQRSMTITVTAGNVAPTISTIGNKGGFVGNPISFLVAASDPDGPLPLTMTRSNSVPALPAAATYVDNGSGTGSFNWTPGAANIGSYQVTFDARDGAGLLAQQTITITVDAAPPPGSGALSGAAAVGPPTENLSAAGWADWVDWGLPPATLNRKSGLAPLISDLTLLGAPPDKFSSDPNWTKMSWSDGTPTASKTNFSGGLYFVGIGNGYELNVLADTTQRTLKLYVGGYNSMSELTATLSDGSAAPYVATFGATGAVYRELVTLTFNAASNGQLLTVRHTMKSGGGNIGVQAAAQPFPLFDDFNDGNFGGWTVVNQTTDPANWLVVNNAFQEQNRVESTASFKYSYHLGTFAYLAGGLALTDYQFSVKARYLAQGLSEDVGVMFRYKDPNNFYRLSFNSRYGFTRLEKRVAGVFSALATNSRGYLPGQVLNISVELRGPLMLITVNGDPLFAVSDTSLPSGTVALYAQDQSDFDDVRVNLVDLTPRVVLSAPLAYSADATDTVHAVAYATNLPAAGYVEFVLDGGATLVDSTPPYDVTFTSVGPGDHQVAAVLRSQSAVELSRDTNVMVGRGGELLYAVGDSINNGVGDEYISDNIVGAAKIISYQGFEVPLTALFDTLDLSGGKYLIYNEAIGGDLSTTSAFLRLPSIMARHPEATRVLISLGTNDGNEAIPAGTGCFGSACDGTFKGNMQAIIDRIVWANYPRSTIRSGVIPIIAMPPPYFNSPTPWTTQGNARLRAYGNVVRYELIDHQLGPDLFAFFMPNSTTYLRTLYYDTIHSNGLGQRMLAVLWQNVLNPATPLPLPFMLGSLAVTPGLLEPRQNIIEAGNALYLDAAYDVTAVPAALKEGRWIITHDADRLGASASYLTFNLDRPVKIYIAYDSAATALPSWMSGFAVTGMVLQTTNPNAPSMTVYSKSFAAGPIVLGANLQSPAIGARANYVAIVVEN